MKLKFGVLVGLYEY